MTKETRERLAKLYKEAGRKDIPYEDTLPKEELTDIVEEKEEEAPKKKRKRLF